MLKYLLDSLSIALFIATAEDDVVAISDKANRRLKTNTAVSTCDDDIFLLLCEHIVMED